MVTLPYVQTSVFVDARYPFGGNQLATFWDLKANAQLSDNAMQGIALEMNFSETTFLFPTSLAGCEYRVRIFTPARETAFAGHPTLGTAYVIKQKRLIRSAATKVMVELGVGPIPVEYVSEDLIQMSQPQPIFLTEWADRRVLASAIGLAENDISAQYPIQFVSTGSPFLIVPIVSLTAVQKAQPNPNLILETLEGEPRQHILIFSTEVVNPESDVHARMFAPAAGIIEDPATGSAAGPLAAYLEHYNVLKPKEKGTAITIEQGYEIQRPSQLIAQVVWSQTMEQVLVSGKVKLVAEGNFFFSA